MIAFLYNTLFADLSSDAADKKYHYSNYQLAEVVFCAMEDTLKGCDYDMECAIKKYLEVGLQNPTDSVFDDCLIEDTFSSVTLKGLNVEAGVETAMTIASNLIQSSNLTVWMAFSGNALPIQLSILLF